MRVRSRPRIRFQSRRHRLGLRRIVDQAQSITEPLNRSPSDEYRSFQGERQPSLRVTGRRREEAVLRGDDVFPCVHEEKGTRTIRTLGQTR